MQRPAIKIGVMGSASTSIAATGRHRADRKERCLTQLLAQGRRASACRAP